MHAVRYEGPEKGVVLSANAPEPPPLAEGDALVRPLRLGVSFADVQFAKGLPDVPPMTIGHEFVGVVERIEAKKSAAPRTAALVGQRVVGSINIVCGVCERCRGGLSIHCAKRAVLGVHARDGCFAQRFTIPAMNLAPVPKELDDDHAVFAEPLAAAIHAVQQLRIQGKPYITVLGDGVMGLLCAQLMAKLNASVRVVGMHEAKLELCARWGIKHRHESEVGRRADQDVVVDCTGSAAGLDLAMKLVRPRGKILLKGGQTPGPGGPRDLPRAADVSPIASNEIELIGSRCGPIAEAVAVLARGEVDVVSLISKRTKLADALDALRWASRPEAVKVLIEP